MDNECCTLLEEVDFLLAEARLLNTRGPRLLIAHRFHQEGTLCCAGEEVALASLVQRPNQFTVNIPTGPLLVLDYLARTRWFPQTATQIARGLASDEFTRRHARFVCARNRQPITRCTVKVYINRIRLALGRTFLEAGLSLDARDVLVSRQTSMNQVLYQLRADVEWVHVP